MIQFTLSKSPPSVNAQTKIGTVFSSKLGKKIPRKMKAADYVAWCALADREIGSQRGQLPEACYYAAYILIPGTCRVDLDNNLKAILDAVRRVGRIPDDRYCVDIRIRFYAGSMVLAAFTEEDLEKWAIIRQALTSRMVKQARSPKLI